MKKKFIITVLSLSALVLVCCGLMFYTPTTALQPREVWRNDTFHWLDYDSWIAGNVLLVESYKKDGTCFCLYALDRSTGQEVWSTEVLMTPYIEKQRRTYPGSTLTPDLVLVGLSPIQDLAYILVENKVLIALDTATGQVRWKQDTRDIYYGD